MYRELDSRVVGVDAASSWACIRPVGVIASTRRCTPEATELLRTAGIRTLLVYGNEQTGHAPSIVLPQREYGRVAVEYLQRQGHQHLLCLMPSAADHDDDVSERLAGVLGEKSDDTTVTVVRTEPSSSSMRDWAHGWRYTRNRPTAIICFDDRYARAAIRALHDAGLTCPGDVAVLGAEDMLFSPEQNPAISSISFSSDTMAERVKDAIQALMSGERVERVDPPPSHLIKRESA